MLVFSRLQDIFKLFILILLFICAFTGMGISQSCNCKEYIYLNEPDLSAVLKFEVGSGIPLTEIVGANGGTPPTQHWYPGTTTSQLPFPHGLASDLNGNLYIGSHVNNPNYIRRLNCDGVIEPISSTTITNPANALRNLFSIGNVIYAIETGGISRYNSCTGEKIDRLCLRFDIGDSQLSWGLSYNEVTGMIYATSENGNIYAFTVAQMNSKIASNSCMSPLLSLSNINNRTLGIVGDDNLNIYVITQRYRPVTPSGHILKIDQNGIELDETPVSLNMLGSMGIIWSRDQNRLYTANYTEDVNSDCISAYDTNLNYLGTAVANPGILSDDNRGKAISILKECCPVNLPSTFTRNVCGATGTKFYLNQEAFDACDGIVCGSSWSPVGTLTNMVFDACDNSVVVTGAGCGTFTLNIGAVISTGCGAQSSTFTICNTVPSATITGLFGTCTSSTPNDDAVIEVTAAMNADQAGISAGATYTGPAYNGGGNITITGGLATFTNRMHNTQYTIRIFNTSNDCYEDYQVMTPSITCNTCNLMANCSVLPQTNCSPVNGSASVLASNALGSLTYQWSSGETTNTISNKAAGIYTVTVTDDGIAECTSICEAEITSTVSAPNVSCTKTDNSNCATPNGTATATATGVTYLWSNAETTATITGINNGTYTVTVTSTTTGCTATCDAIVGSTTTLPTATCSKTDNTNCATPNGTASVTTDGNQIAWSTGATTANITGLSAGTYTVTVTNTTSGCTNTCEAVITNNTTNPIVTCAKTDNTNCATPNGTATATATGVTYLWGSNASNATTATITGLSAGTYTVTVTSTSTGCTATCSAIVASTTTPPTAVCTPLANTNCTTPNGSATVTTNGNQISWSTGGTSTMISGLSAGTYTVTVTNSTTGCSNTCTAVVNNATVNPTCTITANSQPSCANLTGGSVTVNPNPAGTYTYAWSDNGAATATRTGLTGGTYTVTVTTTTTGCTGFCNVTLDTPTNCCNINVIVPQNLECIDNGTPALITDNRIRFNAMVTNTNTSLTSYNVTINGGTTIMPNVNVPYGVTQFTLGVGTGGGGATFTITVTDSVTPGCTQTFQVIDPGNCTPANPPVECPPVKCGTATIQVNGN